MFFYIKGWT